jgi:hypothetical protein
MNDEINATDDSLNGKIVLVHPDLPEDPAGRQNQAGRIIRANLQADDIYVDFKDGKPALYATNALLVLKDPDEIYRILEGTGTDMTNPAIMGSYFVASVLHIGFASADRSAMNRAIQNDGVREICLESLSEVLERNEIRGINR